MLVNIFLFSILFCTTTNIVVSQDRMPDRRDYYSYADKYFFQVHKLNEGINDSTEYLVLFRILYDALTFTKMQNASNEKYIAYPSIEVDLMDKDGIIRSRAEWLDTVIVSDFARTNSKSDFVFGFIILKAPAGNYKLNYNLQRQKGGRVISNSISLDSLGKSKNNYSFGDEIFVSYDLSESKKYYIPVILNGDISFNMDNAYILFPTSIPPNVNSSFNYILSSVVSNTSETDWGNEYRTIGKIELLENSSLDIIMSDSLHKPVISIVNDKAITNNKNTVNGILKATIPINTMYPGAYELKVIFNNEKDTIKISFKVIWEDMPVSLRKIDYAVKAMYYILTDDDFDEMNSGSTEKKISKLLDYWKKQDPTPATSFNEAFAEYFKRVDYAFFNFQTISQKDGAMTDRGKIYILFGEPSSKERILKESKTQEVWNYDILKKEFIFEVVSSGNYKLIKVN